MKEQPEEETQKRVATLSSVLVASGTVIIAIIAIFTILPEFGVNIAAALAGLGIAGLAISFGAQTLIRDIIAGIFILLEDQYRVGDVVNIAGIGGLVEQIGLRRTVLRDLDGVVHSVPNGEIKTASNVTKGFSRVNLNISVAYGENLDHVIEIINKVCQEMAEDPKWKADFITIPKVLRVDKLGDSGIDIKILGDTKASRQWDIMGELRLRLKKTFDKEGIEIPWPHTKVYFGNSPPRIEEVSPIAEKTTDVKPKSS
jgi:small conductance mechanosensitive channel